jgi:hypothetical protein
VGKVVGKPITDCLTATYDASSPHPPHLALLRGYEKKKKKREEKKKRRRVRYRRRVGGVGKRPL